MTLFPKCSEANYSKSERNLTKVHTSKLYLLSSSKTWLLGENLSTVQKYGENMEGKSAKINPSLKQSDSPSLGMIFALIQPELEKGRYTRNEALCASYNFCI